MGTVFRKMVTRPLPSGAKLIVRKGERLAEWSDARGKRKTAPLTKGRDGSERIVERAKTYTAKFRDGENCVVEVATGCRDKTAAESMLADMVAKAEKVRGGILTSDEDRMIDHQQTPLAKHVSAYLSSLVAAGCDPVHITNRERQLGRLGRECPFDTLSSLRKDRLDSWLANQAKAGMPPRTRNIYRSAAVAFCNWCIDTQRLAANPFSRVERANESVDCRRNRRAFTEEELHRLLIVARLRPLAEHGRVSIAKPAEQRKGQRDTWKMQPLAFKDLEAAVERARSKLAANPAFLAKLEAIGWERALIYKTLAVTGLRRGELASLTSGQVLLDTGSPVLILEACDDKRRQGATLPLRADLAADLRAWIAYKARTLAGDDHQPSGATIPLSAATPCLPPDMPILTVPEKLIHVLDRDLLLAGIPKQDERGRTVDVHALRHTFCTLLSRHGVTPRTAQAAMRHSKIGLTMNTYTDPVLLDIAGAVESLPALPLDAPFPGTTDRRAVDGTA